MCVCATCVPLAFRGQNWVSDAMGLELQTIVSCHVVLGIEPKPSFSAKVVRALTAEPSLQPRAWSPKDPHSAGKREVVQCWQIWKLLLVTTKLKSSKIQIL